MNHFEVVKAMFPIAPISAHGAEDLRYKQAAYVAYAIINDHIKIPSGVYTVGEDRYCFCSVPNDGSKAALVSWTDPITAGSVFLQAYLWTPVEFDDIDDFDFPMWFSPNCVAP